MAHITAPLTAAPLVQSTQRLAWRESGVSWSTPPNPLPRSLLKTLTQLFRKSWEPLGPFQGSTKSKMLLLFDLHPNASHPLTFPIYILSVACELGCVLHECRRLWALSAVPSAWNTENIMATKHAFAEWMWLHWSARGPLHCHIRVWSHASFTGSSVSEGFSQFVPSYLIAFLSLNVESTFWAPSESTVYFWSTLKNSAAVTAFLFL